MRIAWISPYLPEPATSGGPIRQQRLAQALAEQAELHLFARGEPWERRRMHAPELSMFSTRWLGRDYLPRWMKPLHPSEQASESQSRRVTRGSPRALWRAVRAAHQRASFDGIVVSHCWAALGAHELGLPWVLDEHNVESEFFRDLFVSSGKSEHQVHREVQAIKNWERRAWQRASLLTCVSPNDATLMGPYRTPSPGTADKFRLPLVVENGTDVERIESARPQQRVGGALFVGSMHHPPNIEAGLRLIRHIMPRVWALAPELSLTIVGGPIPKVLEQSARHAKGRVELTGRVADVIPYLLSHQVFVNPLLSGAGSSLKSVEALAAGIPFVSTEHGVRGFGLIPGTHYWRAESDDEFAQSIVSVIHGGDQLAEMSAAGRAHVRQFAWSALGARFATSVLETFRNARSPH